MRQWLKLGLRGLKLRAVRVTEETGRDVQPAPPPARPDARAQYAPPVRQPAWDDDGPPEE
ncbi:MAG: hypothetical protein ACM359_15590 [Bacillota bacterium]